MSWQTKVYTRESLQAMNPEKMIAERKQKIRMAIHEIQNEVLYRARQGHLSASLVVARTKIKERPDYMIEIMDRLKEMFPDSAIVYGTTVGLMECEHMITVSWPSIL
jgi:hypothetical protein